MKCITDSRPDSIPRRLPRLVEPEVVRDVCRDLGIQHRRRLLDPLTTLNLLVIQVLHGNTALNDLRHKAAVAVSAAAICRARARLPLAFFHEVLARLGRRWRDATAEVGLWRGRRVMIVDGSGASTSDVGGAAEPLRPASRTKAGVRVPGHAAARGDSCRNRPAAGMARRSAVRLGADDDRRRRVAAPQGRRPGGRPGVRLLPGARGPGGIGPGRGHEDQPVHDRRF